VASGTYGSISSSNWQEPVTGRRFIRRKPILFAPLRQSPADISVFATQNACCQQVANKHVTPSETKHLLTPFIIWTALLEAFVNPILNHESNPTCHLTNRCFS
jgi:hypothetical protein